MAIYSNFTHRFFKLKSSKSQIPSTSATNTTSSIVDKLDLKLLKQIMLHCDASSASKLARTCKTMKSCIDQMSKIELKHVNAHSNTARFEKYKNKPLLLPNNFWDRREAIQKGLCNEDHLEILFADCFDLLPNYPCSSIKPSDIICQNNKSMLNLQLLETIALFESTPPHLLALLADSEHPLLRISVALNPNTPENILEILTDDEDPNVVNALLNNPRLPESVQLLMAESNNSAIQYKLTLLPNISAEVIRAVAHSLHFNPKTPEDTRHRLIEDSYSLQQIISKDAQTTPLLLEHLARKNDDLLNLFLAQNPATPPHWLHQFAKSQEENMQLAVALNPKTAPPTLIKLMNTAFNSVLEALSFHPNTPPQLLTVLAYSNKIEVALNVANNPNAPPEALDFLAEHDSVAVKQGVAAHKNTLSRTLDRLANDDFLQVLYELTNNPNTSTHALDQLFEREDLQLQIQVARHPNASTKALDYLVEIENPEIAAAIAKSSKASPKALSKLAIHPNANIRQLAEANPKTPVIPQLKLKLYQWVGDQLNPDNIYYVR